LPDDFVEPIELLLYSVAQLELALNGLRLLAANVNPGDIVLPDPQPVGILQVPNGMVRDSHNVESDAVNGDQVGGSQCYVYDGSATNGKVFADVSGSPDPGEPDGVKVDSLGNVYAAMPEGVWVYSPEGKHLGTIRTPENPANLNWGGDGGKTLYITAVTGVYRVKAAVAGTKALYQ
jgi:hypothetical protein